MALRELAAGSKDSSEAKSALLWFLADSCINSEDYRLMHRDAV
jgi:hypothetical protein